jgi:hypothetical protein
VIHHKRAFKSRKLIDDVVVRTGTDGLKVPQLVFQTSGASLGGEVVQRTVVSGDGAEPLLSRFRFYLS